jgi:3-deoxy-D-manno-octulosonic-acid transferase
MARPPPPSLGYRLLSALLFVVWACHAAWLALQHRRSDYFWQRLGIFRNSWPQQATWIHAASVGEVELIRPLAETLALKHPVVVSCFTITGLEQATKNLSDSIFVIALPIDFWPISRAFIQRFDFHLALIAETELWPETLFQARQQGVSLLQINARLSHKSLSTRGWQRTLLKRTLSYFDGFVTRNENDIENLKSMGVAAAKITLCGNLKYANRHGTTETPPRLIERPYILFASTHAEEERLFAELIGRIESVPLLVIAPRHPKRAAEILKQLKPLALQIRQRSKGETIDADTQLYLADTLGEMKPLMAHARLVVMGGSFVPIGGHNIIEPARLGAAIITGWSDDNIRPDIEFLQPGKAIIQVDDIDALTTEIQRLLSDKSAVKTLQQQARRAVQQQSQILDCYLQVITSYLPGGNI